MNARQKAKKYKKLYNQLLNSAPICEIRTVNFHTLRIEKIIPEEVALSCINDGYYIKEWMSREMADKIMQYIRINTQYDPTTCSYKFAGTIRICD